jgi:hypothetical protein
MFGKFKSEKKTLTNRSLRKIDSLVTGFILGGVVASIYGIKKQEDARKELEQKAIEAGHKHTLGAIMQMLIFGIKSDEPAEKPTIQSKIKKIFRFPK